jgi:polyribonucleotide nucleotidyltransferase
LGTIDFDSPVRFDEHNIFFPAGSNETRDPRIPREYASRVVGQQGQTVRLIVEKSQVGIQIEQSLQKEWSLVYFAGSKRGDTGKAIELIEKRVREVAGKNWSRNGNLVALS